MSKKEKPIKCWHFVAANRRLRYGDNRYVRAGLVQEMRGGSAPMLCCRGMHGSRNILDAFEYRPGPILCRVEIWGNVARGDDKLCGRFRRVLWTMNASSLMRKFEDWSEQRPWCRNNKSWRAECKAQSRKLTSMIRAARGTA